jgi:hypothetical protein
MVQVDGVRAVVLGGSRARGSQIATSDYDLGVYWSTSMVGRFGGSPSGCWGERSSSPCRGVGEPG